MILLLKESINLHINKLNYKTEKVDWYLAEYDSCANFEPATFFKGEKDEIPFHNYLGVLLSLILPGSSTGNTKTDVEKNLDSVKLIGKFYLSGRQEVISSLRG